ncbi:GTPase, partial [Rubrivirga sp.]|uniref:GTPase n=1 Tax=Rubrivirga sp. TaxID=1885344 RepID=UPI003C78D4B7
AYEMAVAVCDADGRADPAETAFLQRLRTALALEDAAADRVDMAGDHLASLDLEDDTFDPGSGPGQTLEAVAVPVSAPPVEVSDLEDDLRPMILRYAVMNGALELLPQKLATLAVVPMQTKMVYRIGQHHGHVLDAAKAKELLGAVGLGLTSQVVETYARGLLGGLMGKAAKKSLGKKKGKKAKKMAAAATGSAFQFAATYALGHAADAYYAGGRRLSADGLRALFDRQLEDGKALYQQHRPAIERQAQSTDLPSLLGQLRSGGASLVPGL